MTRIALLLLALAGSASAQERDTARVRHRPVEVTVTRSIQSDVRTAAPVTVVSAAEIQRGQPTIGLDEALAVVPGVTVNNRYNFSLGTRIAIRGLGARAAFGVRGVRVLVDGVPLTMPDGQANLNNIDLASTGRIEVLRGPASSLYGNAAGGVISLESEAPPLRSFAGELRTVFGDLGRDDLGRMSKHQVKLGGQQGSADYLLSLGRMETDGYRAHSRAEQSTLNARVRFGNATRFHAVLNHADAPVAQNPGSLPRDSANRRPAMAWPRNVATGAGESAQQTQLGVGAERQLQFGLVRVSAYGLTRSLENPLPFGYIMLDRKGGGARAAVSSSPRLGSAELSLIAGTDIELQRDDRSEFDNVNGNAGTRRREQQDRVFTAGPFAQLTFSPTTRLALTAGARYDWVNFETEDRFLSDGRDDSGKRSLQAFSPRIAALFALSEQSSIYGSVSTAFQTPTTTELINRPPVTGSPCCPGGFNESLEPQRALNFELGIKGNWRGLARYELVGFHMKVDDALVPFQVAGVEGREFFRNAGETKQRGLEAALGVTPVRWLSIDAAYTRSDFTFVDDGNAANAFEGNEIPGVAPDHLFGRVRIRPHRAVTVELEHEYTSEFFTDDANLNRNSSAAITDARLILEADYNDLRITPFIALNNLSDERYNSSVVINAAGARYFEPAPGRNLYLGVSLGFRQ